MTWAIAFGSFGIGALVGVRITGKIVMRVLRAQTEEMARLLQEVQ
jgi:hypothetical protein